MSLVSEFFKRLRKPLHDKVAEEIRGIQADTVSALLNQAADAISHKVKGNAGQIAGLLLSLALANFGEGDVEKARAYLLSVVDRVLG